MIDEFQDTNRLQLDVLEALERDNLFAVGDELQSIYGFRHADVNIFRERRARLPAASVRRLTHNFRSAAPLLDVLNGAFASELGPAFTPLVAGRPRSRSAAAPADDLPLRLFDPDGEAPAAGEPLVELLLTDTRGWDEPELERELGLAGGGSQPWRRAEARLVAHRLRAEVDGGRRPGDVVVLVRATGSLRLLEQALEEQGLPTYVVGGRGYWSQEQVRDGIAYLSVLANPQDEEALLAVLASPFCGVGTDALVLLAQAGRESGLGAWAALRDEVERPDGRRARARRLAPPPSGGRAGAAAGLRSLPRRRALARGADAGGDPARACGRDDRIRPRRARPQRRRPAARQPAQADAPRARLRACRGRRPARPGRLRDDAGPRRGARGRGGARVRRARRRAADDDPPRQGARVPRRLRRRPRPRRGHRARPPARGRRRRRRAAAGADRRRRRHSRARVGSPRGGGAPGGGRGGAPAVLRGDDARPGAADPVRRRRPRAAARPASRRPADRLDLARPRRRASPSRRRSSSAPARGCCAA